MRPSMGMGINENISTVSMGNGSRNRSPACYKIIGSFVWYVYIISFNKLP